MAALAAIGGVISGIGSAVSLMYQSAIANANAQQARLDAQAVNQKGQLDTQDIGNQNQGELGGIYSSEGASGFAISSPSFASGRVGFLTRGYTSELRAQEQANLQEANYKTEANIYKTQAQADSIGAVFAGAGGILGGLSKTNLFASAGIMGPDYIPPPSSTTLGNTGAGPMPALSSDLMIG